MIAGARARSGKRARPGLSGSRTISSSISVRSSRGARGRSTRVCAPTGSIIPAGACSPCCRSIPARPWGGLPISTSVDRTTLTRTLGLMEKAGLVARRERESDRRSLAISLTAKGRRLFARILPLALAETDRALTGFSSEEIGTLRDRLKRMADNLRAS